MIGIEVDVAISGGGLAGSLLARQLRRTLPHLRIALFEKDLITSYKVGESIVDLASHYLIRRLGLSSYLYDQHLPKNGLRFFFDGPGKDASLPSMSEIGTVRFPFHPAFQIDRARLEGDLRRMNRDDGIAVYPGTRVEGVALGPQDAGPLRHHLRFRAESGLGECRARWVVDASGRASLLARQLNLRVPEQGHRLTAAWGRFRGVADLDTFGPDHFRRRVRYSSRALSTVHFCYPGYWVWFIPLGRGVTSVGVVGQFDDTRTVRALRMREGFLDFLTHHRAASSLLEPAELVDFGCYRQLAYGTRRFFSADGWALVGEAAAFTDPFYSPGTDFIAIENDLVTDLISRDARGEGGLGLAALADLYSDYMLFRHEASMRVYRGLYSLFGSYELLKLKWQLDIALYYHMWVSQYFRDQHLERAFLEHEVSGASFVLNTLRNFAELFQKVEDRVRATGRYYRLNLGQFSESLEGVDFVDEIGGPVERTDAFRRQQQILNGIRDRALELLDGGNGRVARTPLPLSRFAMPEPLA